MFIREVKTNNKTYLYIIQSYWKNGKSKHRCVGALGSLDELKPEQLVRLAQALLQYSHPDLIRQKKKKQGVAHRLSEIKKTKRGGLS